MLMSGLPGSIEWAPAELESYLAAFAGLLLEIHATTIPAGASLPPCPSAGHG